MLCLLCLWIAPGSIQSMLPHHLSAWLVVLGCLFNLGVCYCIFRVPSCMKNILNITYKGLRPGDCIEIMCLVLPYLQWFKIMYDCVFLLTQCTIVSIRYDQFCFPNPFIAWICHFTIYAQPVPTFGFHLLDYL